ncbi:MAG: hypothetical protein ACE15E_03285 [Acidobacteriota bacterium]
MWLRAILLAFLLNGLSPFGLRILAANGLGTEYTTVYLFYWYLAGLVFALFWIVARRQKVTLAAVLVGFGMAASSVAGQYSMGMALNRGIPGNIVFTLAMGCSICVVAAAGLFFFGEKVGPYGKAGIALGLVAAVLLSVWG